MSKKGVEKRYLYRLGILEKFSIVVGFFMLGLIVTKTFPALCLTFILFTVLISQGISLGSILRFLRIPLTFAIVGLLSIVLVLGIDEPHTLFVISERCIPLSITLDSLKKGEVVIWRALNSLLALYMLIATMSHKEKNVLADKLHIPKSVIELGILSFRYIQLLDKKRGEILIAQQLRLGYSSYRKSFRSIVLLLGTVFMYSITTFRMNYQALLTRGYNGTLYCSNDYSKDRWWFLCCVSVVTVIIIVVYKIYL